MTAMIPALVWHNATQRFTLQEMPDNEYTRLQTAIAISLFTDARCSVDELPDGETDQRGWWGDQFLATGKSIGSKLWLLRREKLTAAVVSRARGYAADAVKWLVEEGQVVAINVTAERIGNDTLAFQVTYRLAANKPWQQLILEWKSYGI